jgi:hypothetical protein
VRQPIPNTFLEMGGRALPSGRYPARPMTKAREPQPELCDYTKPNGRLEIENPAGRSDEEAEWRSPLERAMRDELRAPLPGNLVAAQREGLDEYHRLAALEQAVSQVERLDALNNLADQAKHHRPSRRRPSRVRRAG